MIFLSKIFLQLMFIFLICVHSTQARADFLDIDNRTDIKQFKEILRKDFNSTAYRNQLKLSKEIEKKINSQLRKRLEALDFIIKEVNSKEKKQEKKKKELKPITKRFYVIVSSSIPEDTLNAMARDALKLRRKKGYYFTFVIRGFVEGPEYLKPTLSWLLSWDVTEPISKLNIHTKMIVPFEINPVLVEKLGVDEVPALVEENGNCIVYGDAPLHKLVEKLEEGKCGKEFGNVYALAEENAIKQIKDHIKKVLAGKNIEEWKKKIKEKLIARYKHYKCDFDFSSPAMRSYTYETMGIYSLPFPVLTANGTVVYPQGYSYNPFKYVHLNGSFLIVDLRDPLQKKVLYRLVKLAPPPVTILVVGGDYVNFFRDFYRKVKKGELSPTTFAFTGCLAFKKLINIYHVKPEVPCIIFQKGDKFEVRVFGKKELEDIMKEVLKKKAYKENSEKVLKEKSH